MKGTRWMQKSPPHTKHQKYILDIYKDELTKNRHFNWDKKQSRSNEQLTKYYRTVNKDIWKTEQWKSSYQNSRQRQKKNKSNK